MKVNLLVLEVQHIDNPATNEQLVMSGPLAGSFVSSGEVLEPPSLEEEEFMTVFWNRYRDNEKKQA